MVDYYKDELLTIVEGWTTTQLEEYISVLEKRIEHTRKQIQLLKPILKKKSKRVVLDTGTRGGK